MTADVVIETVGVGWERGAVLGAGVQADFQRDQLADGEAPYGVAIDIGTTTVAVGLYDLADGGKRAVGFKLSDGMEVPEELADRFKFARQKSKLAGTIRGSFFIIKGEY